MMELVKYKVQSLDVMGNEHDGYEINDIYSAGQLDFESTSEEVSHEEIFNEMQSQGYFHSWVKYDVLDFEVIDDVCTIEVRSKETGKPIYFLVPVKTT
jgi:hypothetical protein